MRSARMQIVGLLVLCAVCAELIAAYGDTTGDIGGVAFSTVFFAGLYGAPALLAREVARRRGWGWGALLWLYLGLGVAQACLIDQSLFAQDYMGYQGWEAMRAEAYLPALGFSAANAFTFIGGHLIFSFGAPVALAERWRPRTADRPWLGRMGLVVAAVAYAATAGMIAADPESHSASAGQLAGAAAVVFACFAAAAVTGTRRSGATVRRLAPVWVVFLAAIPLAVAAEYVGGEGWVGLTVGVLALGGVGVLLRYAGGGRWRSPHVAAAGFAFLLVRGVLAFTYYPLLGHVDAGPKYVHNVAMLLIVVAAGAAAHRARPDRARVPASSAEISS
ncbi:hypothetical protein [Tsukamurella paurometabola]|uniref:DUF998 domain-containing protein n=1 Tax=Tsukamurella paurometabola TaxID=2061 RepID=A0A3P8LH94_TSUPA|nr:hypothetical protein [Tsukamurella paurometabola]UEA84060.1 hypothetical protein LK411_04270 [Tsukamurella paurometabola]VDR41222.1 Uncharacterised protein [Tsukamurella paurometabola]